jgi:hypothetical protein
VYVTILRDYSAGARANLSGNPNSIKLRPAQAAPTRCPYPSFANPAGPRSARCDTAVLSRWAKIGTMNQSLISLTIVALPAARAVNIL